MSETNLEGLFAGKPLEQPDGEELAGDAAQLVMIATFNGLCRLIAAVSRNGLVEPVQLANIHEAVTAPLDDPDWRDDSFIARARKTFEAVLARAMSETDEPD